MNRLFIHVFLGLLLLCFFYILPLLSFIYTPLSLCLSQFSFMIFFLLILISKITPCFRSRFVLNMISEKVEKPALLQLSHSFLYFLFLFFDSMDSSIIERGQPQKMHLSQILVLILPVFSFYIVAKILTLFSFLPNSISRTTKHEEGFTVQKHKVNKTYLYK